MDDLDQMIRRCRHLRGWAVASSCSQRRCSGRTRAAGGDGRMGAEASLAGTPRRWVLDGDEVGETTGATWFDRHGGGFGSVGPAEMVLRQWWATLTVVAAASGRRRWVFIDDIEDYRPQDQWWSTVLVLR
ncbi:hypothetical protein ACLOJK_004294 [Asimina triloba]